jgi:hypothetical protein
MSPSRARSRSSDARGVSYRGPCPDATVKFRRNERAPHGVRLGSPHTERPMNAVDAEPTPYFFEVPGLTGTPVDPTQIRGAQYRARRSDGLLGRVPLRHAKHQVGQMCRAYAHHLDACLKS